MRTAPTGLALLLALSTLAGCGDDGAAAGSEPIGSLLTSWSEAIDDRDAVSRFQGGPRLVAESAELDAVIDLASPELDTNDIEGVDLNELVLVVGAFPECDELSSVEAADDGATLRFTVIKPDPDNPVDCEWSPLRVDVWEVPRGELADEVSLARRPDD